MAGPLDGILVLSVEQAVAAPLCTSRLADAGARVIKVERPGGDFARNYDAAARGLSSYFVWTNRGKELLTLDFRQADDLALLHRIAGRADVFVQNLAPGAADRAGFGSDLLRRVHPRLITCDISGYGEDGAYAAMKAYDLLVQAESGLVSVSGAPGAYGRIGVSLCDIGAGISAYGAIAQALYARERSGEGAAIRISLFDVAAEWMTVPLLHTDYGAGPPRQAGLHHPSIAPYGGYRAGDGKTVVLSIQNEREWVRFCADVLRDSALATDPRFVSNNARVANRPALDAAIDAVFGRLASVDLTARLAAAEIAFGAVNRPEDVSRHPQLRRTTVDTVNGPVALPAPPARVTHQTAELGRVPEAGEHSEAIREEFR